MGLNRILNWIHVPPPLSSSNKDTGKYGFGVETSIYVSTFANVGLSFYIWSLYDNDDLPIVNKDKYKTTILALYIVMSILYVFAFYTWVRVNFKEKYDHNAAVLALCFLATIFNVTASSIILININNDLVKNKYLNILKGSFVSTISSLIISILLLIAPEIKR